MNEARPALLGGAGLLALLIRRVEVHSSGSDIHQPAQQYTADGDRQRQRPLHGRDQGNVTKGDGEKRETDE
jgi:hypothetical protein